jgi:carbamoyl-phosphate synthase large subunit
VNARSAPEELACGSTARTSARTSAGPSAGPSAGASSGPRIVLASAGRRVYLVRWFHEALAALGGHGCVIATDADPWSPAAHAADLSVVVPPLTDPRYPEAMRTLVRDLRPDLLLSVNDYELEVLAAGLGAELSGLGTLVPSLAPEASAAVVDKFRMAQVLEHAGVRTPPTVLASDTAGVRALAAGARTLVVKHRCGSGSSGLRIVPGEQLEAALRDAARSLPPADAPERDRLVVQPAVEGDEYGIDLIGDLHGRGDCGVLARRKLRMRDGETYRAVSVPAEEFSAEALRLARVLRPTGPVDIDLIRLPDGTHSVIDVNPRFGGGYAFSHMAGADVPLHYAQQLTGAQVRQDCLSYAPGQVASKFVDIALTSPEPEAAVRRP